MLSRRNETSFPTKPPPVIPDQTTSLPSHFKRTQTSPLPSHCGMQHATLPRESERRLENEARPNPQPKPGTKQLAPAAEVKPPPPLTRTPRGHTTNPPGLLHSPPFHFRNLDFKSDDRRPTQPPHSNHCRRPPPPTPRPHTRFTRSAPPPQNLPLRTTRPPPRPLAPLPPSAG